MGLGLEVMGQRRYRSSGGGLGRIREGPPSSRASSAAWAQLVRVGVRGRRRRRVRSGDRVRVRVSVRVRVRARVRVRVRITLTLTLPNLNPNPNPSPEQGTPCRSTTSCRRNFSGVGCGVGAPG